MTIGEVIPWLLSAGLGTYVVQNVTRVIVDRVVTARKAKSNPPAAANININTAPQLPAKMPSISPDSPTPAMLDHADRSRRARMAGFIDTKSFDRANNLGDMRCTGHVPLVEGQATILTEVRDARAETKEALVRIENTINAQAQKEAELKGRVDSQEKTLDRHEDRLNAFGRGR